MNSLYQTNHIGLMPFCLLVLATLVILLKPDEISANQISIQTQLSQSKIIQNNSNTIYLDIDITSPNIAQEIVLSQPSDIIVVLDKSGSMSGANKMSFAKAAIANLLMRLTPQDRFALVSFANGANILSPLVYIDEFQRQQLNAIVNTIRPGGGTNMGAGLINAVQLLTQQSQGRSSKVILLSDGHANQGISDLHGLSQIVQQITEKEAVLSTIGMGLDFNESLMSSLADYGMGNYDYLEDLSGLGQIFARNLNATRNIYAASSHLIIHLNNGVQLIDAAGYPFINKRGKIHIKTGQLLNNNHKKFVMTFKVNPSNIGTLPLGKIDFNYQVNGKQQLKAINEQQLKLSVIEPQRRQEATKSINQEVYKQSWIKNNYGRMQKKLSHWLRQGDKHAAEKVINEYKQALKKAEDTAQLPMMNKELKQKLEKIETDLGSSFSGSKQEQLIKRKRAAKSALSSSMKDQRIIQKQ